MQTNSHKVKTVKTRPHSGKAHDAGLNRAYRMEKRKQDQRKAQSQKWDEV